MGDLRDLELSVKGPTGVLTVSGGRIAITKKADKSTWSCSVDDVIGFRSKKPGMGSGYLSIEVSGGQPPPTGLMNAMNHPQTIVIQSYGQWGKAEPLITALEVHRPDEGLRSADPLAKVRTAKAKHMKQLDGLAAHLEPGECVDGVVFGVYETELMGSDTVRNGVLAATDRRVVFFAKKLAGFDFESFSYDKLSSFEMSKGMMGEKYTFFASGNKVELKWVSERFGDDFPATVRGRLHRPTPPAAADPPRAGSGSAAEQIRELAALVQEGLLTEDEFAAAKARILGG